MKPNMNETPSAVDRLATSDEIRAAVLPFPDPIKECAAEILHEIALDMGGYVRIRDADLEATLWLDELTREQDPWAN